MSVNRRTRHGGVFGRGTVGSAVAVLPEPMVSGVTGVGCAAAAAAIRKTASERRELMRTPLKRSGNQACAHLPVKRRESEAVLRKKKKEGRPDCAAPQKLHGP